MCSENLNKFQEMGRNSLNQWKLAIKLENSQISGTSHDIWYIMGEKCSSTILKLREIDLLENFQIVTFSAETILTDLNSTRTLLKFLELMVGPKNDHLS